MAKKSTKKKAAKKVSKKAAKKVAKKAAKKAAKKKAAKKASTASVAKAPKKAAEKPAKSNLTKKELKDYQVLLVQKRTEILGDMTSMSEEALAENSDLSNMPLHMADVGSDLYEQELTLGLVESERRMLQRVNEALVRIGEGTYGVCEATGKVITKARLEAKPWAKFCIEHARELERTGQLI